MKKHHSFSIRSIILRCVLLIVFPSNKQANKQTSKQANKQASKQTTNQPTNQASKQANKQTNKQTQTKQNKQPIKTKQNKQTHTIPIVTSGLRNIFEGCYFHRPDERHTMSRFQHFDRRPTRQWSHCHVWKNRSFQGSMLYRGHYTP